MLPIEAGTHCVGGSIDDQAAPLSRRSRAKRRIHTEQFCSRNLIVTPDVSLHAQRARHASAPATGRAARAAGERSAAVQGSGRAAAAGSAGRPADARSDSAGCGPAHVPEAGGGKGCRIDGLERVDIGVDLQDDSLGPLHQRALRRPRRPPADAAVFMARIDLACNAPTEHPDHRELSHLGSVAEVLRIQPCQNSYRLQSWRFWLSMGHPRWPRRRRCRRCLS